MPRSDMSSLASSDAPRPDVVEEELQASGAIVSDRLKGLSFGRRLSWYLRRAGSGDDAAIVAQLRERSASMSLSDFLATNGESLRCPGMYSWWVDESGAYELSQGLGHRVDHGLIYAGLAGATRSGGSTSSNTLWGRIATMHLGKRHSFSTLRYSLGSILSAAHSYPTIDEEQLTSWMHAHLRIVAVPVADADLLDALETIVLRELDPPMNLAKVPRTAFRRQLSALRREYADARTQETDEPDVVPVRPRRGSSLLLDHGGWGRTGLSRCRRGSLGEEQEGGRGLEQTTPRFNEVRSTARWTRSPPPCVKERKNSGSRSGTTPIRSGPARLSRLRHPGARRQRLPVQRQQSRERCRLGCRSTTDTVRAPRLGFSARTTGTRRHRDC